MRSTLPTKEDGVRPWLKIPHTHPVSPDFYSHKSHWLLRVLKLSQNLYALAILGLPSLIPELA